MNNQCSRCGEKHPKNGEFTRAILFDNCLVCGSHLCEKCLDAGCCDNKPAASGSMKEYLERVEQEKGS